MRYVNGPASPLLLFAGDEFHSLDARTIEPTGGFDPIFHNDCQAVPVPLKSNPNFRLTLGEEREWFM